MRSFKSMADNIMKEINVTDSLKNKVLQRCSRKTRFPAARLVAAAACGVIILGILNLSGLLRMKQPEDTGELGPGIFAVTGEQSEITPGQTATEQATEWPLKSSAEAIECFGDRFLEPAFIPDGFIQAAITASGTDKLNAFSVILSYTAGERSFMIIEQKTPETGGFSDFEAVDINGIIGFMSPAEAGKEEPGNTGSTGNAGNGAVAAANTEVHWFKDGVQYSVLGSITQEDALKVARSMK